MSETIIADFLNINKKISYYLLIFFIFVFFLLSSNFKVSHIFNFFSFFKKFLLKKENSSPNQESIFKESSVKENVKETPMQEDLFKNNITKLNELKIKLPLIDFLKKPEKISNKKEDISGKLIRFMN